MTESPRRSRLRVRFFGVPSIEVDGVRAALAADLWPDDDDAATKLRRHLSLLVAASPAIDEIVGRDRARQALGDAECEPELRPARAVLGRVAVEA